MKKTSAIIQGPITDSRSQRDLKDEKVRVLRQLSGKQKFLTEGISPRQAGIAGGLAFSLPVLAAAAHDRRQAARGALMLGRGPGLGQAAVIAAALGGGVGGLMHASTKAGLKRRLRSVDDRLEKSATARPEPENLPNVKGLKSIRAPSLQKPFVGRKGQVPMNPYVGNTLVMNKTAYAFMADELHSMIIQQAMGEDLEKDAGIALLARGGSAIAGGLGKTIGGHTGGKLLRQSGRWAKSSSKAYAAKGNTAMATQMRGQARQAGKQARPMFAQPKPPKPLISTGTKLKLLGAGGIAAGGVGTHKMHKTMQKKKLYAGGIGYDAQPGLARIAPPPRWG